MCGRLKMCMGLTRHPADSVYTKGINERETMTLSEMTSRAVFKGMSREDAVTRLQEGFANHTGDSLVCYLTYWGFATESKAGIIAAEHQAMLARN